MNKKSKQSQRILAGIGSVLAFIFLVLLVATILALAVRLFVFVAGV